LIDHFFWGRGEQCRFPLLVFVVLKTGMPVFVDIANIYYGLMPELD